jgi:hypothetical protein
MTRAGAIPSFLRNPTKIFSSRNPDSATIQTAQNHLASKFSLPVDAITHSTSPTTRELIGTATLDSTTKDPSSKKFRIQWNYGKKQPSMPRNSFFKFPKTVDNRTVKIYGIPRHPSEISDAVRPLKVESSNIAAPEIQEFQIHNTKEFPTVAKRVHTNTFLYFHKPQVIRVPFTPNPHNSRSMNSSEKDANYARNALLKESGGTFVHPARASYDPIPPKLKHPDSPDLVPGTNEYMLALGKLPPRKVDDPHLPGYVSSKLLFGSDEPD